MEVCGRLGSMPYVQSASDPATTSGSPARIRHFRMQATPGTATQLRNRPFRLADPAIKALLLPLTMQKRVMPNLGGTSSTR